MCVSVSKKTYQVLFLTVVLFTDYIFTDYSFIYIPDPSVLSFHYSLPSLRQERKEMILVEKQRRLPTYRVLRKSTSPSSSFCHPRPPATYSASSSPLLPSRTSEGTVPFKESETPLTTHEIAQSPLATRENGGDAGVEGETRINLHESARAGNSSQNGYRQVGLQATKSWIALSKNDPYYASDTETDSEESRVLETRSKRWSFCYGQENATVLFQREQEKEDFRRKFWLLESWYHLVPRMKSHENLWLKKVKFSK